MQQASPHKKVMPVSTQPTQQGGVRVQAVFVKPGGRDLPALAYGQRRSATGRCERPQYQSFTVVTAAKNTGAAQLARALQTQPQGLTPSAAQAQQGAAHWRSTLLNAQAGQPAAQRFDEGLQCGPAFGKAACRVPVKLVLALLLWPIKIAPEQARVRRAAAHRLDVNPDGVLAASGKEYALAGVRVAEEPAARAAPRGVPSARLDKKRTPHAVVAKPQGGRTRGGQIQQMRQGKTTQAVSEHIGPVVCCKAQARRLGLLCCVQQPSQRAPLHSAKTVGLRPPDFHDALFLSSHKSPDKKALTKAETSLIRSARPRPLRRTDDLKKCGLHASKSCG